MNNTQTMTSPNRPAAVRDGAPNMYAEAPTKPLPVVPPQSTSAEGMVQKDGHPVQARKLGLTALTLMRGLSEQVRSSVKAISSRKTQHPQAQTNSAHRYANLTISEYLEECPLPEYTLEQEEALEREAVTHWTTLLTKAGAIPIPPRTRSSNDIPHVELHGNGVNDRAGSKAGNGSEAESVSNPRRDSGSLLEERPVKETVDEAHRDVHGDRSSASSEGERGVRGLGDSAFFQGDEPYTEASPRGADDTREAMPGHRPAQQRKSATPGVRSGGSRAHDAEDKHELPYAEVGDRDGDADGAVYNGQSFADLFPDLSSHLTLAQHHARQQQQKASADLDAARGRFQEAEAGISRLNGIVRGNRLSDLADQLSIANYVRTYLVRSAHETVFVNSAPSLEEYIANHREQNEKIVHQRALEQQALQEATEEYARLKRKNPAPLSLDEARDLTHYFTAWVNADSEAPSIVNMTIKDLDNNVNANAETRRNAHDFTAKLLQELEDSGAFERYGNPNLDPNARKRLQDTMRSKLATAVYASVLKDIKSEWFMHRLARDYLDTMAWHGATTSNH